MKLNFLDANDNAREVDLERRPISENNKSHLGSLTLYGLFESKRLEANIGYIYFTNFIPFIGDRIKTAVESMLDTDGLIIDLRGNSGGDDLVGLKMAGLFFEKSRQLMFSRTRHGDDQFEYFARAGKTPYRGKVVILVDEFSKSASEQFSAGMQESGRAVVIGNKTPGEDLDGDLEGMPDGSLLLYAVGQPRTPKGRIIEGNGVIPNIYVGHTREALLAGRDAQLQAAIEFLRK
jgi:carboxyl-terminal processing protease